VAFSKGAPEFVLASCTQVRVPENGVWLDQPLDEAGRERILEMARTLASRARS